MRPITEDRPRVERYGLTLADLVRIEETTPGVQLVAPSRSFPAEVRSPLTGRSRRNARIVATTAAYGVVHGLDKDLVDESHRLWGEMDDEGFTPVAVLGAEAACNLLPRDEPLGQAIIISGRPFRVVGVLRERPAPAAINPDSDVYIPLGMSRRLFGKMLLVRTAGRFRREEVDLTEILLVLRDRDQATAASPAVRGLLEHYHDKQDWQVIDASLP